MKTPRTIYALLVGINEYPNPDHRLNGCVSDVHRINEYLATHFNHEELTFQPKILTNQEATRANVIAGFGHFQQAKDEDICLFHYSGHGSRCPAPEGFWHIEPDKKHETIVCYDSRLPGGRDLIDKELSFLIWEATKDKDIHFLAILDCCHSGTATRSLFRRSREVGGRKDGIKPQDYLGFDHYNISNTSEFTPPRGRHVLLAAARATEKAQEGRLPGGAIQGVFTYCLLEVLKGSQNQITYAELANRINFRVKIEAGDQSPQLEVLHPNDKERIFLTGTPAPLQPSLLIAYDNRKKNWFLNVGAMHGIVAGDESSKTIAKLLDTGEEVEVQTVYPHLSVVEEPTSKSIRESFKAVIQQIASPVITIAFCPENTPEDEQSLRTVLSQRSGAFFQVHDKPEEAQFLIHAKFGHLFLSKQDEFISPGNDNDHHLNKIRSVFKKIEGLDEVAAIEFLYGLRQVSRWINLLKLANPTTTIRHKEVEIQLFRTTDPGNYNNDVPVEQLDWKDPGPFPYQKSNVEWCVPAFQLKLKNTSKRTLWTSLCYFGDDYSISNALMAKQELAPGEEAWVLDVHNGYSYRTIPLKMDDAYNHWGITTIDEYLKLFICTEEFNTDELTQKGMELDKPIGPFRAFGRDRLLNTPDWTEKVIRIQLERPLQAKTAKSI